jgi:hypothetical protein
MSKMLRGPFIGIDHHCCAGCCGGWLNGTAVKVSNNHDVSTDDTESNWPIHADVNHDACIWSVFENVVGEFSDCSNALEGSRPGNIEVDSDNIKETVIKDEAPV